MKEPVPSEALLCPFAAEHGTIFYGNLKEENGVSSPHSTPKDPHNHPQVTTVFPRVNENI